MKFVNQTARGILRCSYRLIESAIDLFPPTVELTTFKKLSILVAPDYKNRPKDPWGKTLQIKLEVIYKELGRA